jgi:hypothetical protein
MKSRPRRPGLPRIQCIERKELGSATLTVAVLIFFFSLVLLLTALLRRVLTGLAGLLTLFLLSGLATLLALPELIALLILFLHVIRHKTFLLIKKREFFRAFFEIYRNLDIRCRKQLQRLGVNSCAAGRAIGRNPARSRGR